MNGERADAARCAYLEACELELHAFKPGNVSIHSEGHGMTVEDFRRSAEASAPFLCDERLSLGARICRAVEATQQTVGCNTNLGIVLLAAPLIQGFQQRNEGESLRDAVGKVLANTTQADAAWVYRAIRAAQPGGLGGSPEQDVHDEPTVTLLEAMRLAEHRDRIAHQYTNCFIDVFDFAIPVYHSALFRWGNDEWAAVAVFVSLLTRIPDSHIERKFGTRFTRMVADRIALVETALSNSDIPQRATRLLRDVDAEFKSCGINPGTTADLTVACLLGVRLTAMSAIGRVHDVDSLPCPGVRPARQ